MGVFAVFRRKGRAAAEEPAEDTGISVPTADATAEDAAATGRAEEAAVSADSTEIPRQQSAAGAADNEAGEGARK